MNDVSKKRVLFISATHPDFSGGLGRNTISALKEGGYDVDVIVKFSYSGQPNYVKSVYNSTRPSPIRSFIRRNKILFSLYHFFNPILSKLKKTDSIKKESTPFTMGLLYKDEKKPEVSNDKILNLISEKYDIVITQFWQNFINSSTIKALYDKLHCPIVIFPVDMAPLTGGCFYFGECNNYKNNCGRCPLLNSSAEHDISRENFLFKKNVYHSTETYFCGNTWMNRFAKETKIFPENRLITSSLIIDKHFFSPASKKSDLLKISNHEKKFIILFRASIEKRKGFVELKAILRNLYELLNLKERNQVLLLSVGQYMDAATKRDLIFPLKELGTISAEKLVKAYRTASVFLSPSIDDAGPSMVNQSMMCGTPVVAFNIGTAIDVIENGVNGIKATVGDTLTLAKGIATLIRNSELRKQYGINARSTALNKNSYDAYIAIINSIISNTINS